MSTRYQRPAVLYGENVMPTKPDILQTKLIAKTQCFSIEQLHLRFANGEERIFERLRGVLRAVMMVPLLDDNTVLLIREYGAGIQDYCIGLPKGAVHADEELLVAANRELKEEVGYGARELKIIKTFSLSPAYMSRSMHLVLCRDLYEERLPGDEPEPIEVIPWQLDRLDELVARDDFHEARSIAALYMIREMIHG